MQESDPLDSDNIGLNLISLFGSGNTIGVHNMREIKKMIYEELEKKGTLKLS